MYQSTRSENSVSSSYAIMTGIAKDGGLYVKKSWPKPDFLVRLEWMTYQEIAQEVLQYFLDDFTEKEIKEVVTSTYTDANFSPEVVKLVPTKNTNFLSLYYGPTFAFKDMALSMFSKLQELAKKKQNETRKTMILSATSGDTGSAVLSGFSSDSLTEIVIFYPYQKISEFQEKQMHYYSNQQKRVIAIDGNFDDCQNLIKKAFQEISVNHIIFSSANSINIARIIPQVIYYFYAYKEMIQKSRISYGQKVSFYVPTGNFGNVLAGYYAYKMGLPVERFYVCSNENNVLTDFFNTGIYNRNRPFFTTSSPSMDILVSSNLERFLFDLYHQDTLQVNQAMNLLKETGSYQVDHTHPLFELFQGLFVSEEETLESIQRAFKEEGHLIDPHTAVAYGALCKENADKKTSIVVSTASPIKFMDPVLRALKEPLSSFEKNALTLQKKYHFLIDPRVYHICDHLVQRTVWSKEEAFNNLKKLVGEIDDQN